MSPQEPQLDPNPDQAYTAGLLHDIGRLVRAPLHHAPVMARGHALP